MEASILKSTKKILGVGEDDTSFDLDIITQINSAFGILNQLGVGPQNVAFSIEDTTAEWPSFAVAQDQLNLVRNYIYLKTRLGFDPPQTSFAIDALKSQIAEHEVRLNLMREAEISTEVASGDTIMGNFSANGEQVTPLAIWIMNHNLGYNPAAFRFFTLDGNTELEPESITYSNDNRALAFWPEPIAGIWMAS